MQKRYDESETSVFFHKVGVVFHKSFSNRFSGLTIPQARSKLRKSFGHSIQDEVIHYLKDKKIIK